MQRQIKQKKRAAHELGNNTSNNNFYDKRWLLVFMIFIYLLSSVGVRILYFTFCYKPTKRRKTYKIFYNDINISTSQQKYLVKIIMLFILFVCNKHPTTISQVLTKCANKSKEILKN